MLKFPRKKCLLISFRGDVCIFFTLSMMIAALDALTVMETMARVIPTTATTNTYSEGMRQSVKEPN